MAGITVTTIILPVLLAVIIIPIIIGVYVYRDASKRGMNAALWTLVTILAPSLIGFIIYLLVRGSHSDLKCPQCNASIMEQYVACPKCGAKLRPSCPSCAASVEPDWKVCPKCAHPLPDHYDNIVIPHHPKDKTLWKILLAVILIPILLIAMMILLFSTQRIGGGSSAMSEVTLEELYAIQETSEVKDWIESLDYDENKAYAMQYVYTTPQGTDEYYYLLYVPGTGAGAASGFGITQGGLFNDILKVEFYDGDLSQDVAHCIVAMTQKKLKLEIYRNDMKLDCEVIEVDFNPTVHLIEPLFKMPEESFESNEKEEAIDELPKTE